MQRGKARIASSKFGRLQTLTSTSARYTSWGIILAEYPPRRRSPLLVAVHEAEGVSEWQVVNVICPPHALEKHRVECGDHRQKV